MAAAAPELEEYKMVVDKNCNFWVASKSESGDTRQKLIHREVEQCRCWCQGMFCLVASLSSGCVATSFHCVFLVLILMYFEYSNND